MRRYHLGSSSPPDDDQDLLRLRIRRPQRFDLLGSMMYPKSHTFASTEKPLPDGLDPVLHSGLETTAVAVNPEDPARHDALHRLLPGPDGIRQYDEPLTYVSGGVCIASGGHRLADPLGQSQ